MFTLFTFMDRHLFMYELLLKYALVLSGLVDQHQLLRIRHTVKMEFKYKAKNI